VTARNLNALHASSFSAERIGWLQCLCAFDTCFGWLTGVFRPRADLILENLALRQQLLTLHAQGPRPPLGSLGIRRSDAAFLLFDRDSKFGANVASIVKAMGSKPLRTGFLDLSARSRPIAGRAALQNSTTLREQRYPLKERTQECGPLCLKRPRFSLPADTAFEQSL
jgi:hypothetical protein